MDDEEKYLLDFRFLPALLEDYAYYIIKKDVAMFYQETIVCTGHYFIDKKLRFVSTVDNLVVEGGKYRAYIHAPRLIDNGCFTDDMIMTVGSFMARMLLATLRKYSHHDYHHDFVVVGTERVYMASRDERARDLKMVSRVRSILHGKAFLDITASLGHLYPNVKADYHGMLQLDEEEKSMHRRLGEDVKDVSVVWQCGVKRRRALRERRVYSWADPSFLQTFYEMVKCPQQREVVRRMIGLSMDERGGDLLFPPKEHVLTMFPQLRTDVSSWVFVDLETDFEKCIYLVGTYQEAQGYSCLWADGLAPCYERPLIIRTYEMLQQRKSSGAILCYYVAERNFWRERCRFHHLERCMDLFDGMLDLSHIFVQAPLIIRGVFNFKLKNIASKLYDLGYIGTRQPAGCHDGAESVEIARQYFHTRSVDLCRVLEKYNEFDCEVLHSIVCFLQRHYSIM